LLLYFFESKTLSITWITPFVALRSVAVTVAMSPFSYVNTTFPFTTVAVNIPPATVVKVAFYREIVFSGVQNCV